MIKIYPNAMVDIKDITTGQVRTCHIKEIKNVLTGNGRDIKSYIDGIEVRKEDAALMRDLMLNNIKLKEAVNV